jgi:hypothetical protein
VEGGSNIEAEGVERVHRGFEVGHGDPPDGNAVDPVIGIFAY